MIPGDLIVSFRGGSVYDAAGSRFLRHSFREVFLYLKPYESFVKGQLPEWLVVLDSTGSIVVVHKLDIDSVQSDTITC